MKALDSMAFMGEPWPTKRTGIFTGGVVANRPETGDSRRNLEYKMLCNFPWGVPL